MELVEVHELVGRVAAVDAGCADQVVLEAAVGQLRRLKSWVESREVAIARSIALVSSFPEKSLADAARTGLRQAEQVLRRGETTAQVPGFAVSLEAGRVSGEHVDVLARTLRQVDPGVREQLVADSDRLVPVAEHSTPDEFARAVRAEARRLERDSDGLDRLERQKRAIRLNTWIDRDTGMGRWTATWDPETMIRLENRLDAQVQALFHDRQPDGCPTDLLEKQSYLRALALQALLNGDGVRLGRPEIVVVVDHTNQQPDARPTIDWGLPVELPQRVLDDLTETATVTTVVVRNGVIIDAPGQLNLGRTTRLANRAQRRALGAVYATCAIPGCHVRYSRTKLHHVTWWRNLGRTDIDNLLPVCEQHHQNIHNDGWLLTLTPDRTLTIRFPDGSIMTTGPPKRNAALTRPRIVNPSNGIEVSKPTSTLARMPWGDDSADARLHGTSIADSVLDVIGNTPLVRLKRTSEIHGITCVLAMKMETTNPGGSSKDRPALEMILAAERDGSLKPGGTIVEPTSGNTGVGLAIVAAQRGYKCVFVMTDKNGPEKISLLRAYGAEVIVCPVAVPPEDPQSYYKVAERVTQERKAFRPNQYANPNNPLAHELTTGPELWRQTGGRITHFVAGAGTCGTITGTARYLKQQNPNIKVVAGDPEMSVFSGGSGRPYLVEGVGEDFFPAAWDASLYDEIIPITDEASFLTARQVSREEGILIGGSGGLAVAAALQVAKRADPDDIVVVLNPDSGRGYLSRIFDDAWMANFGFLRECDQCIAAVLDTRGDTPSLLYVNPSDTVRHTIDVMRANGVSQLPVCKNTPPFANAEVSGSVDELDLMESVYQDPSIMDTAVEKVMGPKLPTIGVGQKVGLAVEMLDKSPALLTLSGGRPLSVLTRTDLLTYFEAVGNA